MSRQNPFKAFYRRYPDLCWTALALVFAGLVLFSVNRARHPQPLELPPEDPARMSPEHRHVQKALLDPESLAQREAEPGRGAIFDPAPAVSPRASGPAPVAGTPLPAAWDSRPAPDLDPDNTAALDPGLGRSLAASRSLRAATFTDPGSARNQEQVEALRRLRQARQQP